MVHMYHSFLIHSSADGRLGCFHVLAVTNRAAIIMLFLDSKPFLMQLLLLKCVFLSFFLPLLNLCHLLNYISDITQGSLFWNFRLVNMLLFRGAPILPLYFTSLHNNPLWMFLSPPQRAGNMSYSSLRCLKPGTKDVVSEYFNAMAWPK